MEIVKDETDGGAHLGEPTPTHPGWLSRLLVWRSSTAERAVDKDPMLWRHRDIAT